MNALLDQVQSLSSLVAHEKKLEREQHGGSSLLFLFFPPHVNLMLQEEKMNALLDQVQSLTSLVAHEKNSNESNTEEAALQQTRVQQLAEHLAKETAKSTELEKMVATLQAQRDSSLQAVSESITNNKTQKQRKRKRGGEKPEKLQKKEHITFFFSFPFFSFSFFFFFLLLSYSFDFIQTLT
jgi:hypothetical protein